MGTLILSMLMFISEDTIVLVLDRLGIVDGIILRDRWGKTYLTWAHKSKWDGSRRAYVYPLVRVGHVILNQDGTTGGYSSHIKEWKPL